MSSKSGARVTTNRGPEVEWRVVGRYCDSSATTAAFLIELVVVVSASFAADKLFTLEPLDSNAIMNVVTLLTLLVNEIKD